MSASVQGCYEIRAALPATLDAVDDFVSKTRRIWCLAGVPGKGFSTELLLRETLTNAVVHGSGSDPQKLVRCILRVRASRLFFVVQDGGAGFDWRSVWSKRAVAAACSGRGIEIVRTFATRVKFNRRGNQVAVAKRIE